MKLTFVASALRIIAYLLFNCQVLEALVKSIMHIFEGHVIVTTDIDYENYSMAFYSEVMKGKSLFSLLVVLCTLGILVKVE